MVRRPLLPSASSPSTSDVAAPMIPSRKQPGDLVGVIPPDALLGKSIQYYIEGYDAKGRACGTQGNTENPIIMKVSPYAGVVVAQSEDVEDPMKYVKQEDERQRLASLRDRVYFDLGVGTGGALITAGTTTEVAWFYNPKSTKYEQAKSSSTGFTWSGLGLRAEFGAFLWRGLSLGVSGRFEAMLNHNADSSDAEMKNNLCVDSQGRLPVRSRVSNWMACTCPLFSIGSRWWLRTRSQYGQPASVVITTSGSPRAAAACAAPRNEAGVGRAGDVGVAMKHRRGYVDGSQTIPRSRSSAKRRASMSTQSCSTSAVCWPSSGGGR